MKYRSLLAGILLLFLHNSSAQQVDWQHYQSLKCSGPVPNDFTELSSKKYEAETKSSENSAKGGKDKSSDEFFLQSNFQIDGLLHSGRVLFGDPVTEYLNNIKNILLKDNPELRDQIRIYTLRSTIANAYTTNDGIVLFTTGLFAQAENEAQLAFVLCHEFNHYIQKHPLIEYEVNQQMEKGSGIYRNLDQEELELRSFAYSKELEREADSLGLIGYLTSQYSLDAARKLFDVLLYSDLPFDEVPFPTDYFNEKSYRIPSTYFAEKVNEITAVDDYDDTKLTHPNIKSRRTKMIQNVSGMSDEGRKNFIQPEATFYELQNMCRYEDCLLDLSHTQFESAFYNSFLLQQNDSTSLFLKKIMTRSLYAQALYYNYSHTTDDEVYYDNVEGESEQVYYLFDKMPRKEFNVLALRYAWQNHLLSPDDVTIDSICYGLAEGLMTEYDLSLSDFKDAYPPEKSATDTTAKAPPAHMTKAEKIRWLDSIKNSSLPDYWRLAFVDFMKDDAFIKLFPSKKENAQSNDPYSDYYKRKHKPEYALGVDRTVIVNPIYYKIDETSSEPVKYLAAEQLKLQLQTKIENCADEANLKVEYLESSDIKKNSVDEFNDLALLNNWISEELDHEEVPVINSNNEAMALLTQKYKTDHFTWLGVINYTEKKKYVGSKIALGCFIWPYLPFAISNAVKPNIHTAIFTIVVNGKTGELEMQFANVAKSADFTYLQKSNLYYIFQQMKNKAGPMKKLFLSSVVIFITATVIAQVPGYMGKRFSLYYEPTIGFAIQPKNTGDAGENKNTLGINFRNDFSADYVVSRGVALGVSAKIVSCKLNDALYYGYNQNNEYQIFSGDVKVTGSMFSFYIKNFNYKRRGFLAPTGVYSKWEVVYGKFKGSTGELLPPPPEWESAPAVGSVEDIYGSTPITHLFGIIYSFGRQNLVSDKIFINTGASIGVMFESLGTQSFMSGGPD